MKRRHLARYFAFDLLSLNGEDLTQLPLLARKEKLKRTYRRDQPMFSMSTIRVAMGLRFERIF
jgi:ATP-dependent DNA ligase